MSVESAQELHIQSHRLAGSCAFFKILSFIQKTDIVFTHKTFLCFCSAVCLPSHTVFLQFSSFFCPRSGSCYPAPPPSPPPPVSWLWDNSWISAVLAFACKKCVITLVGKFSLTFFFSRHGIT